MTMPCDGRAVQRDGRTGIAVEHRDRVQRQKEQGKGEIQKVGLCRHRDDGAALLLAKAAHEAHEGKDEEDADGDHHARGEQRADDGLAVSRYPRKDGDALRVDVIDVAVYLAEEIVDVRSAPIEPKEGGKERVAHFTPQAEEEDDGGERRKHGERVAHRHKDLPPCRRPLFRLDGRVQPGAAVGAEVSVGGGSRSAGGAGDAPAHPSSALLAKDGIVGVGCSAKGTIHSHHTPYFIFSSR